jgi:hydroxylamine reductase (hybrid-cluster protein)
MTASKPALSVQDLFAAKDAAIVRRRAEEAAATDAKAQELKAFTDKVMNYQITDEDKARALAKIRHAFENGDRDVMIVKFPSNICEDSGRRIHNHLEGWQDTLPGVLKHVYEWWETDLKPGGFTFGARVINFQDDGIPGDVGIFIGWPEREL